MLDSCINKVIGGGRDWTGNISSLTSLHAMSYMYVLHSPPIFENLLLRSAIDHNGLAGDLVLRLLTTISTEVCMLRRICNIQWVLENLLPSQYEIRILVPNHHRENLPKR